MKTRKIFSFATAAVMALSALPVLSAGAADGYVLGDVDKDGIITGHDSALVSRSLYDDTFSLTEEETAQADINQDGTVDQTDLDWIHENEAICIGDLQGKGNLGISDAFLTLVFTSSISAGNTITIDNNSTIAIGAHDDLNVGKISQVNYNLMDCNADGEVTLDDVFNMLYASDLDCLGLDMYFSENRYDLYNCFQWSSFTYDGNGDFVVIPK